MHRIEISMRLLMPGITLIKDSIAIFSPGFLEIIRSGLITRIRRMTLKKLKFVSIGRKSTRESSTIMKSITFQGSLI